MIKNVDIDALVKTIRNLQYGASSYPYKSYTIIIDDFDDCSLGDRLKENIIKQLVKNYRRVIVLSYASASSVLFASEELPPPHIFNINPLTNDKILQLVTKWKSIGLPTGGIPDDREVLVAYEKIQLIFDQSEIEKSAYSTVTFLELMETASGGDLVVSSFASCYETLVTSRLQKAGIN